MKKLLTQYGVKELITQEEYQIKLDNGEISSEEAISVDLNYLRCELCETETDTLINFKRKGLGFKFICRECYYISANASNNNLWKEELECIENDLKYTRRHDRYVHLKEKYDDEFIENMIDDI